MSISYVCADSHLGQDNVCKMRPQFSTREEHDEHFYASLEKVRPHDTVYFLGDVAKGNTALMRLKEFKFRKKLVLGNHCTENYTMLELLTVYDSIDAYIYMSAYGAKLLMSHIPADPISLRGAFNVHGHEHERALKDPKYRCVSLDQTGGVIIKLEDVVNELRANTVHLRASN